MTIYNIGQVGSAYQELSDIQWNSLQPGDVVNVHWRPEPYNERLLLNAQGTEEQPIVIQGVPGPNGEMPVLDANNATTPEQFSNFNLEYRQELGGSIFIGTPQSYPSPDEIPEHITISGFEITGAGQGNSFTDADGISHAYEGQAGVYVKGGDDIIIENNYIHHNGTGIFSNSNHDFEITEDLIIQGNTFDQNGVSGSYLRHHVYTEGINTTVDNNVFLAKVDGDLGSLVKMRDVGLTISNNEFGSSPGHIIDMGDVQSDAMVAAGYGTSDAFHHDNHVFGNTINAETGNIYLGGDSLGKENVNSETYRKSVDFHDNTITYASDQDDLWRLGILRAPSDDQTFNIANNSFSASSKTPGDTQSNFALMADDGNLNVTGPNTIDESIAQWADNASQNGTITGWENMTIVDDVTDPVDPDPIDPDPVDPDPVDPDPVDPDPVDPDPVDPDPVDPDPVDPDPVDPDPVDPQINQIDGTDGADSLFGKAENDVINGMAGDDTLYGYTGNDIISGGAGSDFVSGDGGDDSIFGGLGDDYLEGSYGDDVVSGDEGNDRVMGGHGSDQLSGGDGNDKILGGNDDDALSGDAGDDELQGGSGNDTLAGGAGLDTLMGGEGTDTFVFTADTAFTETDTIWDFSVGQGDKVNITDLLQNFDATTDNIEDFVSLTQSGWKHALLSVDVDGGGDNFQAVAIVGYGKDLSISEVVDYSDLIV
ncbi:MAG: type I secretion C-terminal target domain-containing protein [Hyphomicrobiales bacterium]